MSLKAHWKLDGNGNDSSGNGHNLSGAGNYTHGRVWTAGVNGSVIGDTCGLNLANHADFRATTHTISAWVKLRTAGLGPILECFEATHGGFFFGINADRKLILKESSEDAGASEDFISTRTLDLHRWYHVAVSAEYMGSTVYFYIDGVVEAGQEATLSDEWTGSTEPIQIGFGVSTELNACIDDVKFDDEIRDGSAIAAEYAAGRDSGPAIYTLRSDVGSICDFSTWDTMATMVQSLFPLVEDVSVYCQGGQEYGADGVSNIFLTPSSANGNNKILWVTTDPEEISTPSKILGRINTELSGNNMTLKISKLKCYGTFGTNLPYGDPDYGTVKMEDCFIAVSINEGSYCLLNGNNGWIRNCTIAFCGNPSVGYQLISTSKAMTAANCSFLVRSSSAIILGESDVGGNKNSVFFNYGTGTFLPYQPEKWSETLTSNPNFIDTLIQSGSDTPSTVIARNAHLTTESASCLGNADPATATATDIEGKARG